MVERVAALFSPLTMGASGYRLQEVKNNKAGAGCVSEAARRLSVEPANCLAVEDSGFGSQGRHACVARHNEWANVGLIAAVPMHCAHSITTIFSYWRASCCVSTSLGARNAK